MPKQATQVKLSEREQNELEHLIKRHRSEQQQVLRALLASLTMRPIRAAVAPPLMPLALLPSFEARASMMAS